jgi:crotonobetainyl-CoA:carnitine CoA-transferase CaiB-like acyl-CoA transferase
MSEPASGPLSGIRVLDLTRVVMGPFATQILADQGADVVMLEAASGDTNRFMGPGPHPELSGIALNMLRNKRSVQVDLKDPAQVELVQALIRKADVLVATMRPGVLTRLGLDYDTVSALNPDIVYCQAQGWPLDSELADSPAYDDIIQAAVGVGDMMQRVAGEPRLLPTIFADKVCGLAVAQCVTAALFHRERTGEGQHVEVPMTQAMTAFMLAEHGAGAIPEPPLASGKQPATGYSRIMSPHRRPQRTADGYVQMLPYAPAQFARIFADAGEDDLASDPRLVDLTTVIAHADELYEELARVALSRTTEQWLAYCTEAGIPATALASLQDLVDGLEVQEHPVAGSYRVLPMIANFSRTPATVNRSAPLIGQHTDEATDRGLWP